MINREKAMLVWEREFGSATSAYDSCDRIMYKSEYGETTSTGWEVDHIFPASRGGSDELNNLQPLHWETNREKDDSTGWVRGICNL